MLDKLPAQLRHFVLIIGAVFLGPIVKAVIIAQGVTGMHWHSLLVSSANTAIVAGLTSNVLLNLTPLTRQYGAFAKLVPAADSAAAAEAASAALALKAAQSAVQPV